MSKRWLFYALALAVMLSACTLDPNKKKLGYLNRGEKYFKAGNYSAAEVEFRNAVALDPKFEQAHLSTCQDVPEAVLLYRRFPRAGDDRQSEL